MIMRAFAAAAALFIGPGSAAFAIDHSTKNTSPRSPTELCCVAIPPLPPIETSTAAEHQALIGLNQATAGDVKPGLDGADWNCRRPDGSQRCISGYATSR